MVAVINRHSARGPLDSYYDSLNLWTNNTSQNLTTYGSRMAYVLGATYVKNYSSLLLPYSASTVNVESTNYERTMNTAASFMQGVYNGTVTGDAYLSNITAPLYNQTTINQVLSALNKTSVKFNTSAPVPPIHINDSIILAAGKSCTKSSTWQAQNVNSTTVTSIYTTYMKDVVAYLKTKKISAGSMNSLSNFGDLAICSAFAGLPIPGGIDPTSQYYQDLKFSYDWTMANQYTAQALQTQLSSIDLFENVLNLMDKVVAGKSTLKYSQYSAHDVTLLPLLSTLGVVNSTCLLDNYVAQRANQTLPYPNCVFPGFTANIAFELYGGSSPSVRVLYNGNLVKICSDAYSCGLTAFRSDIETKMNYTYNSANFKLLCAA